MYDLDQTAIGYNLQQFFQVKGLVKGFSLRLKEMGRDLNLSKTPRELPSALEMTAKIQDEMSGIIREIERIDGHDDNDFDPPSLDDTMGEILDQYQLTICYHIRQTYPLVYLPTYGQVDWIKQGERFGLAENFGREQWGNCNVIGFSLVGTYQYRRSTILPTPDEAQELLDKLNIDRGYRLVRFLENDTLSRIEIRKREGVSGFILGITPRDSKKDFFPEGFPFTRFGTSGLPLALVKSLNPQKLVDMAVLYHSLPRVKEVTKLVKSWRKS